MPLQLQHIEFQGEYFSHYYLCNYRPKYTGTDQLSNSLIRFKQLSRIDVEAWTECALSELKKLKFKNVLTLRALGSNETSVPPSSRTALDWMGKKIAQKLEVDYCPELLSKIKATHSLKLLTKTEREMALQNVYSFNGDDAEEVLILDDILTTGTTMKAIIQAIRMALPSCPINLFTLASTDHQALLNSDLTLTGTSYTWQEEEWQTVAETEAFYNQLDLLKSQILNDSFE